MAGQIKIVVTTNAASAQRDLVGLGKAVGRIGSLQPAGFNKAKFAVSYAGPAFAAYQKLFRKTGDAQRQFQQQAARGSDIPIRTTGLRQAIRDYASLGGEARTTLADMNRRTTQLEDTSKQAYSTATTKLEQYKNSANTVVGRIKRIAVATAAIGTASRGISAASGYLKTAVTNASNLNETSSKAQQIFKGGTGAVTAFAKTADRNLGLSQAAALDAASSFGDMFQQIGFGQKQAAKLSTGTLQLAADLGSFSNVDVADVTDRISSAYRGEYDSLQKLIPNISAARVQTVALAQSHKKSAKQLTAQDKALAVNAIITKDGARAQGDFARTGNSLANVQRANAAGLQNLSSTIGTALLPGVTALALAFRDKVLPALNALVSKYAPAVNRFFTHLAKNGFSPAFAVNTRNAGVSLKAAGTALGTLAKATGSGVNDTLTVGAVVLKTLADHADLLAKAIPLLVAGYLAVKIGQGAATAIAIADIPIRVAEIGASLALASANRALAVAIGGTVRPSLAARSAALATGVANGIASAATYVWATAQGALNAVMSLNPIALVVIAIVALVAIVVIVARRSDRFRAVLEKLWGALKSGLSGSLAFVRKHWVTIAALLGGPLLIAVRLFVKHKTKILSIFRSIKAGIVSIFAGIGGLITSALKATINSAIDLIDRPLRAVNAVSSKVPGVPDLPLIPKLAKGGIVTRPTLLIAGEAGSEAIVPLKGRGFGTTTNNYTITVQAGIGNPVEIGRSVVTSVQAFERARGQLVLSNAS